MDLELRCPSCKSYYQSPVYLPCSHSLCYICAVNSVQIIKERHQSTLNNSLASDLDQLSFHSDNDSGVIANRYSSRSSSSSSSSSSSINCSSRPSSLFLPPALPEICSAVSLLPQKLSADSHSSKTILTGLSCPVCSKITYIESSNVKSLPKNRLLIDIIDRYLREKSPGSQAAKCQLCHSSQEKLMQWVCEQCQIGYCDQCREQYHPMRGPYAKHTLVHPSESLPLNHQTIVCPTHIHRLADHYCLDCRTECCQHCSSHISHESVPLQQAAKTFKVRVIAFYFIDRSINRKIVDHVACLIDTCAHLV